MEPLRFCMITTFYPPYAFGGDAVFVERLAGMLARRGHEVDVIHCVDSYRALAAAHLDRYLGLIEEIRARKNARAALA